MQTRTRHDELARQYPGRTFNGTGGTSPWFAGDVPNPDVIGWLMSIVPTQLATDAYLRGTLTLRRPWKGDASRVVADFDINMGGLVYVPWPSIELAIVDANTSNSEDSTLVVSFDPVLRGDPPPHGIQPVLYGRAVQTAADTASFTPPFGATDYRVEPASSIANDLSIEEKGAGTAGSRVYGRYTVAETTAQTPGVHNGEAAWRPVPPGGPSGSIDVTVAMSGSGDVTVFYRYCLGAMR